MAWLQTSDGLRLAYLVDNFTDPWKPAATVVLLHAAMSNARRLARMVPALGRHARVVRIDLRGHGASEVPPPEAPLSMPRLVADVVEVLNRLGVEKAHFVGVAMGGSVAQNVALAAPSRVRSLSLFGSLPGMAASPVRDWPARIRAEGLRGFVESTLAERFDPARTEPALLRWFVDDCARIDPEYAARYFELMAGLDWSDQLHRIACPALVVMPGAESIGGTARYHYMHECLPDARLLVYEGMPHNVCDADPDRCAADVLAFLRERFGDPLEA